MTDPNSIYNYKMQKESKEVLVGTVHNGGYKTHFKSTRPIKVDWYLYWNSDIKYEHSAKVLKYNNEINDHI